MQIKICKKIFCFQIQLIQLNFTFNYSSFLKTNHLNFMSRVLSAKHYFATTTGLPVTRILIATRKPVDVYKTTRTRQRWRLLLTRCCLRQKLLLMRTASKRSRRNAKIRQIETSGAAAQRTLYGPSRLLAADCSARFSTEMFICRRRRVCLRSCTRAVQ